MRIPHVGCVQTLGGNQRRINATARQAYYDESIRRVFAKRRGYRRAGLQRTPGPKSHRPARAQGAGPPPRTPQYTVCVARVNEKLWPSPPQIFLIHMFERSPVLSGDGFEQVAEGGVGIGGAHEGDGVDAGLPPLFNWQILRRTASLSGKSPSVRR